MGAAPQGGPGSALRGLARALFPQVRPRRRSLLRPRASAAGDPRRPVWPHRPSPRLPDRHALERRHALLDGARGRAVRRSELARRHRRHDAARPRGGRLPRSVRLGGRALGGGARARRVARRSRRLGGHRGVARTHIFPLSLAAARIQPARTPPLRPDRGLHCRLWRLLHRLRRLGDDRVRGSGKARRPPAPSVDRGGRHDRRRVGTWALGPVASSPRGAPRARRAHPAEHLPG